MEQAPRSPAPRSRGTLALGLVDGEVVGGVVCLAVALLKGPCWQVLTQGQGVRLLRPDRQSQAPELWPADSTGPSLVGLTPYHRFLNPSTQARTAQDGPGLASGSESPGTAQPEGHGPALPSLLALVSFCLALPHRNGCSRLAPGSALHL